jgi:hypothetical protein
MWESVVVILGHSRVHLSGEEFLLALIHPLSGHLIGNSIGITTGYGSSSF